MFKKIGMKILIGLVILIVIIAVGKNIIAKTAITTGVKAVTGLNLKIDSMKIGIVNTLLGIKGLVLYNPEGFEDKIMMDLPEIYVDYDLGAFLKKKVHLKEVRLDLKEFVVVKNKEGVLNLDSLTAVQGSKKETEPKKADTKAEKAEKMEIQIDLLSLKFGKVKQIDYSGGGDPVINEYNINIDETFENITDPNQVVKIILAKVLPKLSAQLLKNSLIGGFEGTIKESQELVKGIAGDALNIGKDFGGTAEETVKNTTNKLKKLLPFGK